MMENLKRAYKSYHPRENQYYEEIDEEYLKNVRSLKEEIRKSRERFCVNPPFRFA
jgi:hypothetical protein